MNCPRLVANWLKMEAFDLLLIWCGENIFAFNNACPHLHFPLRDSDVTEEGGWCANGTRAASICSLVISKRGAPVLILTGPRKTRN